MTLCFSNIKTARNIARGAAHTNLRVARDAFAKAAALRLLEAARTGDVETARALLDSRPRLVNCRDVDGRHSTPLHFAAGYNRLPLAQLLLQRGADVHAKDKGGLVPLHNACSYGHYEVTELLVSAGAGVNAADLWRFTPLHEAAAKGKADIVRLLLKHGADPTRRNRDGLTPLQLVRAGDCDTADALRGDAALLDAAKRGDLARAKKLITAQNVNCRDAHGRNSTPLHLAAGYNNLEVAEALLEAGAAVSARDKGGLVPLHNAASYGHLELAALLLRAGTPPNAADRWGFTPLHEAAHKARTQLCALLVSCHAHMHTHHAHMHTHHAHMPTHHTHMHTDHAHKSTKPCPQVHKPHPHDEIKAKSDTEALVIGVQYDIVTIGNPAYPEYLITYQIVNEEISTGTA
ncbi:Tankyrase-1 [Papilio machaon]|uniref:Tankyrase-1 n=1 Tax=Papilio machaon TaxID=76193 RepID=A0A0N1IFG2_PAPMA|nr:Tankyrase-1 [Papilio machaon]